MHLINLLPTLLLITPALSAPLRPENLEQRSKIQSPISYFDLPPVRHEQRRNQVSQLLTRVTSYFDPPSVRSEQRERSEASIPATKRDYFDKPSVRAEQALSRERKAYVSHTKRSLDTAVLETSTSGSRRSAHDHHHDVTITLEDLPSIAELDRIFEHDYNKHHDHHHHAKHKESFSEGTKQTFARFRQTIVPDFQEKIQGMCRALGSMSESLAISGAVAVVGVLIVLASLERWMGARLRWARARNEYIVIKANEKRAIVYGADVKVPFVEEDVYDQLGMAEA